MEFIVKQSVLLRELSLVQGVVERKNTVPILANILMSATGETVSLMATDLEVSMRSTLTAAVQNEGSLSVSGRMLHEIVRSLPDSDIQLKSDDDNWATITCERSHFRLMGLSGEQFPALPKPGSGAKVVFGIQPLRQMIQKVVFAVANDDGRYALNGALLIVAKGTISLVASDGHRLAYVSRPLASAGDQAELRVVVPHKALMELARIGEEIGGEVLICREDNQIFFETGRALMSSRLLEGQFPSYEKVLPKGNDKIVELPRGAFGDALKRVALLSSERNRAVKVSVGKGKVEISAKNPEVGEARETLAAGYNGADVEIGFNARYILDFLGAVETDVVCLELKDEATQGLLKGKEAARDGAAKGEKSGKGDKTSRTEAKAAAAEDYQYVVMPMRI